jgi:hypothetical protein
MQPNRRPLALVSLISLVSLVGVLGWVSVLQNVELGEQNDVGDGIARMGIEGEGDIPLPVA